LECFFEMNDEKKSLALAVVLSFIAIYSVNAFFGLNKPSVKPQPVPTVADAEVTDTPQTIASQEPIFQDTQSAVKEDTRLNLQNDAVLGSIRLKGARFDNLYLKKYKKTLDSDDDVELFKPQGTLNHYFAELGWLTLDKEVTLPSPSSMWQTKDNELSPKHPVTLTWHSNGITIIRKIALDNNYMFTVTDEIENNSGTELEVFPYALISKNIKGEAKSNSVVHEGMLGIIDDTLKEFKYSDLKKGATKSLDSKGGWVGFTDRYWFSSLILDNNQNTNITFKNSDGDNYQVDFRGDRIIVPAHKTKTYTYKLFAGAKEIKLLDTYKKELNIPKFDLAVDFGWYYFLTKPFFYILDFLYGYLGNMGWAILLFAAILRLLMFPIANKSYTSMAKMKALQPKLNDIKEKYGNNNMLIQQATMELYKREKVNPASGCLPLFIQIPVFFSLYKVLNFSIEIRHAPFVGWIKDLSAPDPLTLSQMLHIYVPSFIDIGVWPILMGITMYLQQKLNPQPMNKDQARMFALMPVFFTFMLGHFASGLVIYWTLSNILSIIQQKAIMVKNGVK